MQSASALPLVRILHFDAFRLHVCSGGSGICILGPVGWPYFQLGAHSYTIAATDPEFGAMGVCQGVWGEAEAFSLNYRLTLILAFLEHDM